MTLLVLGFPLHLFERVPLLVIRFIHLRPAPPKEQHGSKLVIMIDPRQIFSFYLKHDFEMAKRMDKNVNVIRAVRGKQPRKTHPAHLVFPPGVLLLFKLPLITSFLIPHLRVYYTVLYTIQQITGTSSVFIIKEKLAYDTSECSCLRVQNAVVNTHYARADLIYFSLSLSLSIQ